MKILVVDDDISVCLYLKNVLEKLHHDVIVSHDAKNAWEIMQSKEINILLTDWVMPGLSGIDLCQLVRNEIKQSHYVYIILLTGKSSDDDRIIGFDSGADDFISKPVIMRELSVRIKAAQRVIELEHELVLKNQQLELANDTIKGNYEHIKRDIDAAAQIQQTLLPHSKETLLPVNLSWDYIPADVLAGDLFNFYPLDNQHIALYLIDVAGHGVPAAMFSVYLNKMLSPEKLPESIIYKHSSHRDSHQFRSPAQIVQSLNDHFLQNNDTMLYFTMIYAIINTETGAGELCQAGHPYPLISRKEGVVDALGEGGHPVGLIEDACYENVSFNLKQGDRLTLYSDGVTECFNADEIPFEMERLKAILSGSNNMPIKQSIKNVVDGVKQWHRFGTSKTSFEDDISLLSIEIIKGNDK
ncbi:MAG: fused response regulator/phosphatase [Gammaproteobacteria bacterium]|nr:fused response regulator/phosphatase [Gammaproteobacteria bacterium]